MNRTGTEIVIIAVIKGVTVLALIMTGNIADTGMSTGVGDILFFLFRIVTSECVNFCSIFQYRQQLPCTQKP